MGFERTLVIIKPDAVVRGLVGQIIQRLEQKGLKIVASKMLKVDEELAREHYSEHKNKSFFEPLINYITSSPSLFMVIEGKEAIKVTRKLLGDTDPKEASPGTIRGDLGLGKGKAIHNVIHASDSIESAEKEINLFFDSEEIYNYEKSDDWYHKEY